MRGAGDDELDEIFGSDQVCVANVGGPQALGEPIEEDQTRALLGVELR